MSALEAGDTPEDAAFRTEVRDFLKEHFDSALQSLAARQAGIMAEGELARQWHKALFEKGWIAPAWPVEYGGPGWTFSQRQIFDIECAKAGTPELPSFGLGLCGPVIMKFGSPVQKDYFLPRILSNEHFWCQGYSEPGAGSDLASLQTRAVRDGDEYVVNGTKIWTTQAHNANWIFLLVRTSTERRPQEGITFLVTPLDAPGITIRPIISLSGEHEVNQVFFDNVRVPVENRFGEENAGWSVAKYLLEFERGGGAAGAKLHVAMERVKAIARREPGGEEYDTLLDEPAFRRKVTELEIEIMALNGLDRRYGSMTESGQSVGSVTSSMKKLLSSQLGQRVAMLEMEALGVYATPNQFLCLGVSDLPPIGPEYAIASTAKYLNSRASTIYGGSQEIQHNILAKVALGI